MSGRFHRLIPSITTAVLLCCCIASAQEDESPPMVPSGPMEEMGPESPTETIQEAPVPIHLITGKDGKIQPLIGWTIEEIEALYKMRHLLHPQDQTPRFSIQSITSKSTAKQNHAELSLVFEIRLRDANWVRVPLRLSEAVLRGEGTTEGPDEFLLHLDPDEGHIAWIRGDPKKIHRITLNLLVPLTHVGDETRLRLSFPAATKSELNLTVPVQGAEGEVTGKGVLLTEPSPNGPISQFQVMGPDKSFQITWRKADGRISPSRPVLEAVGTILAQLSDQTVTTQATLTIRSFGGAFDRFRVRLPEGAELIGEAPSGYRLLPEESSGVVEVRLPEATSEPVEVRLSTRRMRSGSEEEPWFELGGFEVIEAVRQSGHIGVGVRGDWHVLWGPQRGVRRIDEFPETLDATDLTAGFEYFSQPCLLSARVVPRKTRISVEPEYLLLVDSEQVRLQATLKYNIRGAEHSALDLELPGWELDGVGPDNLVADVGVEVDASGLLSIPVKPSTGLVEVTLSAHRTIPPKTPRLSLQLPYPRANATGPAAVVVLPADNVEIIPDAASMVGLVRQQVTPPMTLPERQQAPLFYRIETAKAQFIADLVTHEQSIDVDVTSHIDLVGSKLRVEQTLAYTIGYVRASTVHIDVPRALAESGRIEVRLNGSPLAPADAIMTNEDEDPTRPVRQRITLPTAWIGPCRLEISYPITMDKLQPNSSLPVMVPLVMPADGVLRSNRLSVVPGTGTTVHVSESLWTPVQSAVVSGDSQGVFEFVSDQSTSQVVLGISQEDHDASRATVVEKAWIQTWQENGIRSDRAVFCLLGDQRRIELIVPEGADPNDTALLLDGEMIEPEPLGGNRLAIELPEVSQATRHSLVVSYSMSRQSVGTGPMSVELPRLGRKVWVRRLYWQLILPRNEHMLVGPRGMTPEFRRRFSGGSLRRWPTLEESGLAAWCDLPQLVSSNDQVSEATSRYLYSALGPVEVCAFQTADRSWIVGIASGLALLGGLMLIYVRASRHPVMLLVSGILLLAASSLYPDVALLAGQAACLGLALSLFAALLAQSVSRRQRRRTRESASSVFERSSIKTHPIPVPDVNQGSTETAPAAVPIPAPDQPR